MRLTRKQLNDYIKAIHTLVFDYIKKIIKDNYECASIYSVNAYIKENVYILKICNGITKVTACKTMSLNNFLIMCSNKQKVELQINKIVHELIYKTNNSKKKYEIIYI